MYNGILYLGSTPVMHHFPQEDLKRVIKAVLRSNDKELVCRLQGLGMSLDSKLLPSESLRVVYTVWILCHLVVVASALLRLVFSHWHTLFL